MAEIVYTNERRPDVRVVCELFDDSGIIRPTDQPERIGRMLEEADIIWTAWAGERLVGISRAITDFVYCCYLSDLAVAKDCQGKGIGKKLIRLTQEQLGEEVMILLLAAATAKDYYGHIGFDYVENGWMLPKKR